MELLQAGAISGGLVALLMSLLASLPCAWWVANVLANIRLQLGVLGIACLVLAIGLHNPLLALVGIAVVLLNGVAVVIALRSTRMGSRPDAGGRVLRVMSLNLWCKNRDSGAVLRQLEQVGADILLLQEVGRYWASALEGLGATYPHTLRLPCEGAPFGRHGPLLLSRHPILSADPQTLGGPTVRLAAARLAIGEDAVWIGSVHLIKPGDAAGFTSQCRQLEALAAWVNRRDGPILLGGDLNATATAPGFLRFLAATGLTLDQQAVPSQTLVGTYPACLRLLGVKIDHILVRGITVARAWTLPRCSSDHRGVVAEIVLPGSR